MERQPRVTIVTPTYNSEDYLEKCILSVKNQRCSNLEHIVVDGGSKDGTLSILKKYEGTYCLKWISEPDQGMYDAINKGFAMASGDIMAWLNSDDYYFPWTIEVVIKAFEDCGIEWLSGIPSNTKKMGTADIPYLLPNLPTVYNSRMIKKGVYDGVRMYYVQQESCFWKKSLWEKAGGLKTEYRLAGDYYLWREFSKYSKLYTINCNLASFRIHENQMSSDKEEYSREAKAKRWPSFLNNILQVYLQIYSLIYYRRFVINIDRLYRNDKREKDA